MGSEKDKGKKEAALWEELTLLGNMMKLHEWTRLDPREAEEEAELEAKLDSEAAGLKTDQWQNKREEG
jgi:hypothetical protein